MGSETGAKIVSDGNAVVVVVVVVVVPILLQSVGAVDVMTFAAISDDAEMFFSLPDGVIAVVVAKPIVIGTLLVVEVAFPWPSP